MIFSSGWHYVKTKHALVDSCNEDTHLIIGQDYFTDYSPKATISYLYPHKSIDDGNKSTLYINSGYNDSLLNYQAGGCNLIL
jgi:hypothetical protein